MLWALVLCKSGGTYSLKSTTNERILRNFYILYTLKILARNMLTRNHPRNIFFLFRFDAWPGIWTRALRLISQYTFYWINRYEYSRNLCLKKRVSNCYILSSKPISIIEEIKIYCFKFFASYAFLADIYTISHLLTLSFSNWLISINNLATPLHTIVFNF